MLGISSANDNSPLPTTAQSPMSVQDIIRTEFKNNGTGMDWQKMYATIAAMLKTPQYRMLRSGNSLLLVRNDGQGNAYVFMASADRPLDMIAHMKEFLLALQKAHFKKVSFDTPRPAIIRLIKATGFNFTHHIINDGEPGTGRPSIHIEVEL